MKQKGYYAQFADGLCLVHVDLGLKKFINTQLSITECKKRKDLVTFDQWLAAIEARHAMERLQEAFGDDEMGQPDRHQSFQVRSTRKGRRKGVRGMEKEKAMNQREIATQL